MIAEKEKIVFHVVSHNKLSVGQHLQFGKALNRFGERINSLEFKIKGEDVNQFVMIHSLNSISQDEFNEIKRYVYETCLITREYALETVRAKFFAKRPSRFKCLYACETLEQAENWANNLKRMNRLNGTTPLQIVKLRVKGNIFKAEGNLMLRNTQSMNSKFQMAQDYWQEKTDFVEPELLIEGEAEVLQIIKEF